MFKNEEDASSLTGLRTERFFLFYSRTLLVEVLRAECKSNLCFCLLATKHQIDRKIERLKVAASIGILLMLVDKMGVYDQQ